MSGAIWVVDDDAFALKLLQRQLGKLGLEPVQTFQDSALAIATLAKPELPVRLILLDLQMPCMDGIEFLRKLVELDYRGQIILISGEDQRILQAAERLARSHKLHVLGALSKPVDLSRLRLLLQSGEAQHGGDAGSDEWLVDEAALRRALQNHELVAYFEPQVDLHSGRVVGVESLVRWQHPEHGLVYPGRFVPEAERFGLIDELTLHVLRSAMAQCKAWVVRGLGLRVSVNVSMQSLAEVDWPEKIVELAAEADLPLTYLVLEVTESQLAKQPEAVLDILARMRLKRVSLAIDDFGTGYSSLTQLRDLPFDEMKLDRSFVHAASADPSRQAIISGSLEIARQLGMHTVAEGVGSAQDWVFMREAGCHVGQGYFIAQAMPGDKIERWVAEWPQRYTAEVPQQTGA